MDGDPVREAPFFFSKPADSLVPMGGEIPFPPATRELHHEVELVVALGSGGRNIGPEEGRELVYGYAVGIDLTRRDIQRQARADAHPWDMAKGFDGSAPCSTIKPISICGHPRAGLIFMLVNGELRQSGDLSDQIWSPEETLSHLSHLVALAPGDLVFTGTPPGVGPLRPGDHFEARVEGVGTLIGSVTRAS
jgi:fumarylpyruvate hydrolase